MGTGEQMVRLLSELAGQEVGLRAARQRLLGRGREWVGKLRQRAVGATDEQAEELLYELAAVLEPLARWVDDAELGQLLGRLLSLAISLERRLEGGRRCLERLVDPGVVESAQIDDRPLLVVNPGQASTKLSLVRGLRLAAQVRLHHDGAGDVEERTRKILEQLERWQVDAGKVAGITGRAGFLAPVPAGIYRVVAPMLEHLQSPRGRPGDEMSLALLQRLAQACSGDQEPLLVVANPLSTDEREPVELLTGMLALERSCGPVHALNHLAARRLACSWLGWRESDCHLLSAHLGSAGSLARHCRGRLTAVVDTFSGFPSTNHCGNLDLIPLLDALDDNRLNIKDLRNAAYHNGGLLSLAGTNDFRALLGLREHGASEAQRRKIELLLDFFSRRVAAEMLRLAADGRPVQLVAVTGGVTQVHDLARRLENNLAGHFPVVWMGGTLADLAMAAALVTALHQPGVIGDYGEAVAALDKRRREQRELLRTTLFTRPVLFRKPGAPITSCDELIDAARIAVREARPPRIAIVGGENEEALLAARQACAEGRLRLARFLLVGDFARINELAYELDLTIDDENITVIDSDQPVPDACALLTKGQVDILMKGSVKTEALMHGVLRALKQAGRLPRGTLVSHVVAMDVPRRRRLLLITDAAINPYPDEAKKIRIIENALRVCRCLDIERPAVAVISAIESVNPGIESSIEAERIAAHFSGRQDCLVEGPLSFDVATDPQIAAEKNYRGRVAGTADVLLMPDIDAANVLYKTLTTQSGAVAAGVTVCGELPLVLTSRGDAARTKLASIALAVRFLLNPEGDVVGPPGDSAIPAADKKQG